MASGLLSNANPQDVSEATDEHVQKMDSQELGDQLEGAAEKLQEDGQGDLAQQVMGIVSQVQSNPLSMRSRLAFESRRSDWVSRR